MRDGTQDGQSIRASENSIAIGGISIGGNAGNIHIGHTIGFTSDQVSTLITQISTTFEARPFDGLCPYKGLDFFGEEDAELFFGREKWVEDLIHRVKASRTLFVTGQSGSGKSSLVRAGLIPALKKDKNHGGHWLYSSLKPGRDPVEALAGAFSRLKDPGLGKYLRENSVHASTLHECAESVLTERADQRVVLFLDQFEEVFTQLSQDKAQTFINLLAHAATVENGRVILLFSMRSDFVPNCAAYPELNALLNQQFVQIGAMQPEELVGAIAQPALRVGLKIDPDLIAQIIKDMKGEPGALPLMQFALKDLFDSRQAKGGMIALTLSDYLKHGGINEALERHANASLATLTDQEKELARSVFSGLIEIGRGTQDTRRTALSNELIPADEQADAVKTVVQKLASARLVTTDAATVTISHEKLIDAWPWLKKLVNENREIIALQNEIAANAKEWNENKRDASYLYTGARLANAREKLHDKKLALGGLAQVFITAGVEIEEVKTREEEARRQKELEDARILAESAQARARAERRGRLVTIGMLAVAIVFVGFLSITPIRNILLRQQAMGEDLVYIPASEAILGGPFYTTDDPAALPEKTYTVETFSIEPYEVTNKRYLLCVQAGVCSLPIDNPLNYNGNHNAQRPVVKVTAVQASQFCDWLDRRLPNDFQWERAARYTDGRIWPWGNSAPSPDIANFFFDVETDAPAEVGHFEVGKSQEGVYDLAGNVWEWTISNYYEYEQEVDLSNYKDTDALSTRGGAFDVSHDSVLQDSIAYRYPAIPLAVSPAFGFRCVSK